MTRGLGIEENVEFLGWVEHEEVISYMKASRVFVLPSIREGFSIAMLEASASGLPSIVVMHPMNAAAWIVRKHGNGIACRPSAHDMAEAIRLLLSDRALLKKMGERALELARRHDWNIIIEKLERTYQEVMSNTI